VLPHLQDTGGFFLAVLQKNGPCEWENKKNYEPKNGEAGDEPGTGNGNKRKSEDDDETKDGEGGNIPNQRPKKRSKLQERFQGYKEDPFLYSDEKDAVLNQVMEYFDIKALDHRMFFSRSRDGADAPKNSFYFASKLVRNILENNVDNLKIINTGVKAFAKCENKGATIFMRLAQEGSMMTLPFVNSKIIKPTLKDLELLLNKDDEELPNQINVMEKQTQEQLDKLDTGSIALVYEGKNLGT
jgi:tRNA (cytosine34-C5)-methyltransferase